MSAGERGPAAVARRRVGLFVALHVAAVVAAYALALAVGGGLATPPLPPDLRLAAAAPAPPPVPRTLARPQRAAEPVLPSIDIAPPWTADDQGRVRLRAE